MLKVRLSLCGIVLGIFLPLLALAAGSGNFNPLKRLYRIRTPRPVPIGSYDKGLLESIAANRGTLYNWRKVLEGPPHPIAGDTLVTMAPNGFPIFHRNQKSGMEALFMPVPNPEATIVLKYMAMEDEKALVVWALSGHPSYPRSGHYLRRLLADTYPEYRQGATFGGLNSMRFLELKYKARRLGILEDFDFMHVPSLKSVSNRPIILSTHAYSALPLRKNAEVLKGNMSILERVRAFEINYDNYTIESPWILNLDEWLERELKAQ